MAYREVFVGNLPATATEDDLRTLFYSYGAVESVELNQVRLIIEFRVRFRAI